MLPNTHEPVHLSELKISGYKPFCYSNFLRNVLCKNINESETVNTAIIVRDVSTAALSANIQNGNAEFNEISFYR